MVENYHLTGGEKKHIPKSAWHFLNRKFQRVPAEIYIVPFKIKVRRTQGRLDLTIRAGVKVHVL